VRTLIERITVIAFAIAAPLAAAQDALTIGSTSAGGTSATVPVYLRDVSATRLGSDAGAGKKIGGIGFRILATPASAVSSINFTRAGVTQSLTPLYETTLHPAGTVSYVVSFEESTNPIPLTLNAAAPGNLIGNLAVTLTAPITSQPVTLSIVPGTAALSNQAGTITETATSGLQLVAGTITAGSSGLTERLLFWRHSNGQTYEWQLDGSNILSSGGLPAASGWDIVGSGDFDADGDRDLVWQQTSSGQPYLWFMQGNAIASSAALIAVPDAQWRIVAVGDLNGDGRADLFWHHAGNPSLNYVWLMSGSTIVQSFALVSTPSGWSVAGSGDFDNDGTDDILWRYAPTNAYYIWRMSNGAIAEGAALPAVGDAGWSVAAIGDTDGDGKSDLIWRHASSGANYLWRMNGFSVLQSAALTGVPDLAWTIGAAGDFNHDGRADLLWRHGTSGANYIWFLNGTGVTGASLTSVPDTQWTMAAPKAH